MNSSGRPIVRAFCMDPARRHPPIAPTVHHVADVDDITPERVSRPGKRAVTISVKRLSKRFLKEQRNLYPPVEDPDRPVGRTRACCDAVPRPCPYVSCKYNLYLDVNEGTGSIKLNFPDLEPYEMPPDGSCALDVADGPDDLTLEEVGERMNITRERVRQLVDLRILPKLRVVAKQRRLILLLDAINTLDAEVEPWRWHGGV